MASQVLIIANPISGGGKGEALAQRLGRALERRGIVAETHLTTLERTGRQIASEVDSRTYRAIAVVGGDGSMHDVIGGLRHFAAPIALLPAGTANVWAREARIPRSPEKNAALIEAGRTVRARLFEANGRRYFLFCGAGIDARIVERVEAVRERRGYKGGMSQWVIPGWTEFVRRPLANLTIEVEGRRIDGLAQVLATRVRSYAGSMSMPTSIDIADGKLHVLAFARHAKPRYIAMALRATTASLREGPDLTHLVTEQPVRIESSGGGEPYHLDGDHAGQLPIDITPCAQEVELVVP